MSGFAQTEVCNRTTTELARVDCAANLPRVSSPFARLSGPRAGAPPPPSFDCRWRRLPMPPGRPCHRLIVVSDAYPCHPRYATVVPTPATRRLPTPCCARDGAPCNGLESRRSAFGGPVPRRGGNLRFATGYCVTRMENVAPGQLFASSMKSVNGSAISGVKKSIS